MDKCPKKGVYEQPLSGGSIFWMPRVGTRGGKDTLSRGDEGGTCRSFGSSGWVFPKMGEVKKRGGV